MDTRQYAVYMGDCGKRLRPLKEVALREWEIVFEGSSEQCDRYITKNPTPDNLCYCKIDKRHIPTNAVTYASHFRDRVNSIKKIMSEGGLQQTYLSPGKPRKWLFRISFDSGTEGDTAFQSSSPPIKVGDVVVYKVNRKQQKTQIVIL